MKGESIDITDFAASYQYHIAKILCDNTMKAAEQTGIRNLCLAGGVAANSFLRSQFEDAAGKNDIVLRYPSLGLCTDNAAMIASCGYYEYISGTRSDMALNAVPSLVFE